MEKEIWKNIEGFENYQISSYGRVKSYYNNKESILKQIKDSHGYYFVNLYKNKISKISYLHRLVSENFIENPENKPQVNHKDGIKTNNHISNLEFCTAKENIQHAFLTGLMENCRKASKESVKKAHETNKKPVYSKKLDMQFESRTEAAKYIQSNYFKDTKLECLQTGISLLLLNKVTKSKYDFFWSYV